MTLGYPELQVKFFSTMGVDPIDIKIKFFSP